MTTTLSGVGMFWAFLSVTASFLCCSGYYLPFWIQGKLRGQADTYFGPFRRCNYPQVTAQGNIEIVYGCGRYSKFSDIPTVWWQCTTIFVGLGCALTLLVAITATSACCFSHIIQNSTAKAAGTLQLIAGATIPLQSLLDHTLHRLSKTLTVNTNLSQLIFEVKWGADGTSGFQKFHQKPANADQSLGTDEGTMFVMSMVPLTLKALLVCGGGAVYPVGWDNRELKQSCGNSSAVYKLGTCQLSWSVYLLGSAVALLLFCFALSFCSARETNEHPSFRMSSYPDGIASVT